MLAGSHGRPFEVGSYRYDTWVARTRMPHTATWVAFQVRGGLPALTISGAPGPTWSRPWPAPRGRRPLDISEAFDARFTVWSAPEDDDRVRLLLAPAAQEALLDLAATCDLEVVGDRLYVVAPRALATATPAFWEWVEDLAVRVVDTVDPQPGVPPTAAGSPDAPRRARRAELFATPAVRRSFATGCLVPLVVGALTAVASVTVRW